MNFTGGNNTAGTSTIPSNNLNLQNMYGKPYNQSGQQYNALLQQGYTGNDIRNALTTNGKPVSDSDYGYLVQNAGMTSPTSRPYAGSDQFFQPVYNSSYQNYANPLTAFNTSTYGTNPTRSNASQWWQNQGATDQQYMQTLRDQAPLAQNMNIGDLSAYMQQYGISPSDMQAAGSYGGSTYGGFNPGGYTPQIQQPFNPYTNSSGFGGGFGGNSGGGFGGGSGGGFGGGLGNLFGGGRGGYPDGLFRTQTQTPFSYQQPMQPTQPMQTQQTYPTQSYQGPFTSYSPMSNPFSYQQQSYQQPQQYNPYQQYEQSLGSYNPYQMQSPFSYQQPSYGGYSNYDSGYNYQQPTPEKPTLPPPRSSGPTSPIVGRSAGFRGTPNVMRRAEGGIASLMDDVE
jgi:hypothetical protein